MKPGTDVSGLIRSGDFPRIHEIDYMPNPRGTSSVDWIAWIEVF